MRFGLLGGRRPTVPWEFYVTLGGALLGASILFAILFPFWAVYPWAGIAEIVVFLLAAGILLAIGILRRRREAREEREYSGRPRIRPLP